MGKVKRVLIARPNGSSASSVVSIALAADAQDPMVSDAFALGVVIFGMVAQDYPWLSTKPGELRRIRRTESQVVGWLGGEWLGTNYDSLKHVLIQRNRLGGWLFCFGHRV